jgi:hypothetical protein
MKKSFILHIHKSGRQTDCQINWKIGNHFNTYARLEFGWLHFEQNRTPDDKRTELTARLIQNISPQDE